MRCGRVAEDRATEAFLARCSVYRTELAMATALNTSRVKMIQRTRRGVPLPRTALLL